MGAGLIFPGMIGHAYTNRLFNIKEGLGVVIYNPCHYYNKILTQLAVLSGALVIGIVSSDDEKKWAKDLGCHFTFNRSKESVVDQIKSVTKGYGMNIAYNPIGGAPMHEIMEILMPMGLIVCYKEHKSIPPISMKQLASKGLFITSPSLRLYYQKRMEYVMGFSDIFNSFADGRLKLGIGRKVSLNTAMKAFQESHNYADPILIKVN